jgi:hypothetical protein
MRASENPLLLGSSGHTELAEGTLDGSVVGCQPQTFSRSASSATCSRLSLPLSSRTLLLGRPTEVLLAPPESAILPRLFRHLAGTPPGSAQQRAEVSRGAPIPAMPTTGHARCVVFCRGRFPTDLKWPH